MSKITPLSLYERETIIMYNDQERTANVFSASPRVIKKLDELVKEYPDTYKVIKETNDSKTYECPKKMVFFRKPVVLTEEQRRVAAERLKEFRENNSKRVTKLL